MPFEHVIDHENRLVNVRGAGHGTLKEIIDSMRSLYTDPSVRADYRFMVAVNEFEFDATSSEMLIIVSLLKALRHRFIGRIAFVDSRAGRVTTTVLVTLLANNEDGKTRHFISENEARNWLFQQSAA